jgi:hypothetical protein
MAKQFVLYSLLSLLVLCSGCRIVSPLMLEPSSDQASGDALPLAVGVSPIQKDGAQRLTHVQTYQVLGIMGMSARMPRREEPDYLNKSIANALQASGTFQYVYPTPFDHADVDVVISVEVRNCRLANTPFGTVTNHLQMVPTAGMVISIGQLLAIIPQEHFKMEWEMVCKVSTREGRLIKEYTHVCKDGDFVSLWSQPFGNYMWYESLFVKQFGAAMDLFTTSIRNDRSEILQAVGRG